MPYLINHILHYRDCEKFYQRLEYEFEEPEHFQYVPGKLKGLIPESAKLRLGIKYQVDIPLFNGANHTKIVDDLHQYSLLYLEMRPDTILEKMFVEPDSVTVDILHGEGNLIYVFYNSGNSKTGVITATLGPDTKNVYSKVKANPQDLEFRQYFLKQALRKPGTNVIDEPEQFYPEYMTAGQVADYLGVKEKTVRNWTSQKKIPFSKIGGGTVRYKRSLIDDHLSKES